MIKNYLTIALRNMMRNKGYSIINILGLAVGIACTIVILLYVNDELSFDRFHEKGDRIYRMALDRQYPGRTRSYAMIPHSFSQAMKDELPEIEEAVRVFYFQGGNLLINSEGRTYEESKAMWADSTFFDIFSIKLLQGNPQTALTNPNTVVITEATAKKYFGDKNPIGEVLDVVATDNDLVVTGVCENVPGNSHLVFDLLRSSTSLNFLENPNFISFSAFTYFLLKEGVNPEQLEAKFPALVEKYAAGQIQRQFSSSYQEYVQAGNGYTYFLQALPDIYLHSNLEAELRSPGSITRIYIFAIIAVFILLIAIINFMNLSTARSTERAKEVGIRKSLGSLRGQLISQFLTEAGLIAFIAMLIGLVLLNVLLPVFNDLSGKEFAFSQIVTPLNLLIYLAFCLIVGILAGAYPAVVLSGFDPISVLKGKLISTKHGILLRNGLVVFQFAISVILIISTIIVYNQLQYIRNKELGFNKEQLLSIQGAGFLQEQKEAFKEELLKLPEVKSVGGCNALPGGYFFGTSFRKEGENETSFGSGLVIDEDFISCLEMEVLEGRDFSDDFNDSLSLIINQTAVNELQLEDPVGQRLLSTTTNAQGEDITTQFTIVGVVKDFHFQSLHQVISPVYFYHSTFNQGFNNLVSVRVNEGDLTSTIEKIETTWAKFLPAQPFRFSFLDNDLDELYQSEQVAQKVFGLFSLLAIFIACLGLLGLAAYITQQRTKEIGIRKVLGASFGNIMGLLSKDFLKLVAVALLFSAPVAWYAMHRWLENFAYSVGVQWWTFLLAGGLALLIAFLTVGYQSVKAAVANPVRALKDE